MVLIFAKIVLSSPKNEMLWSAITLPWRLWTTQNLIETCSFVVLWLARKRSFTNQSALFVLGLLREVAKVVGSCLLEWFCIIFIFTLSCNDICRRTLPSWHRLGKSSYFELKLNSRYFLRTYACNRLLGTFWSSVYAEAFMTQALLSRNPQK